MPLAQPRPARRRLAALNGDRYLSVSQITKTEPIMFARIARRIDTYRHLWKQEAAFRDRRVAGVLIAFFGR